VCFIECRSNEKISGLLDIPLSAFKAKRVRLKVLSERQPLLGNSS
jgi:hypothetical protein